MAYLHNGIAVAILSNGKRVGKLRKAGSKMRELACNYVVAECATQKVRLSGDDIIMLGCQIAMRV